MKNQRFEVVTIKLKGIIDTPTIEEKLNETIEEEQKVINMVFANHTNPLSPHSNPDLFIQIYVENPERLWKK